MHARLPQKLHCYAVKENDQWIACCLDFTLAAQADSFEEALANLKIMINEYIKDIAGPLSDHRQMLLNRKAPASEWIKYFYFLLLHKISHTKDGLHRLIDLPIPKVLHAHR